MPYVIAEPCIGVKDAACIDSCPVDAIHPLPTDADFAAVNQLFIDPGTCIDCGMCIPACPVSAIFAEEDLPAKWIHFVKINADGYRQPGGDLS